MLLEKEKTIAKLKHQIGKDVEKKIQDQHRRYLLGEQVFYCKNYIAYCKFYLYYILVKSY